MKRLFAILAFIVSVGALWAVPARRGPMQIVQPNGDTLDIRLVGDEHWHARYTEDGYLIAMNEEGYYCYAKWEEVVNEAGETRQIAVPTKKTAKNADKRKRCEKRWIRRHKISVAPQKEGNVVNW